MTPTPQHPEPARDGDYAVVSPYETCPACKGSGMGLNPYNGDPGNCWDCNGDGRVRARDDKGRFIGNTSCLPAGYAEYAFKEAVEDIVRQCGGNRFIAHGMAVEMVREVTGVKSQ